MSLLFANPLIYTHPALLFHTTWFFNMWSRVESLEYFSQFSTVCWWLERMLLRQRWWLDCARDNEEIVNGRCHSSLSMRIWIWSITRNNKTTSQHLLIKEVRERLDWKDIFTAAMLLLKLCILKVNKEMQHLSYTLLSMITLYTVSRHLVATS